MFGLIDKHNANGSVYNFERKSWERNLENGKSVIGVTQSVQ